MKDFCIIHGETEFRIDKNGNKRCKTCERERLNSIRRKYKEELVKYKGGKCEICGYDKCITALEFHHLNPSEKDFSLSNSKIHNLEKLKKEADKCILVCSNCHREIHFNIDEAQKKEILVKKDEKIKEFYADSKRNTAHRKKDSFKYLDENLILESIKNNETKQEICKKLKINPRTLNKFLKENGVVYRERNNNIPSKEVLAQLIGQNSMTKIGELYGVSDNAVRKWCKKYGLPYTKKEIKKFISSM